MLSESNPIHGHEAPPSNLEHEEFTTGADVDAPRLAYRTIKHSLRSLRVFSGSTSLSHKILYCLRMCWSMYACDWVAGQLVSNIQEPEQIYERLQTQWATIGIVSSLVLSMAMQSLESPPDVAIAGNTQLGERPSLTAYVVVVAIAAAFFVLSLAGCIIFTMVLNSIPKDAARVFVGEFRLVLTVPEMALLNGLWLYVSAVMMRIYITFGGLAVEVVVVVAVVLMGSFVSFFFGLILYCDRVGGIWDVAAKKTLRAGEQGAG